MRAIPHAPAHPVESPRYRSVYGTTRWKEFTINAALAALEDSGYYALTDTEREIVDAILG